MQVIRYCYRSAQDYFALRHIIEAAELEWLDMVSSTRLAFGPAEIGVDHSTTATICGADGVDFDALIIAQSSDPGVSGSTVGYAKPPYTNEMHLGVKSPGQHAQDDSGVVETAHELGHVLGLYHEHSRPDRDR